MASIYTKSRYLLILFILGFAVLGCKPKKNTGLVPTYVHVDSFSFQVTAVPNNIAHTHKITCVWAYYNNNPIGVFDLPADIPIIANGTGVLMLKPGISVSGLNNFLAPYPFYKSDTTTIAAQPGQTINYVPKTSFYSSTLCVPISNFDSFTGALFKSESGAIDIGINSDQNGVISLTGGADTLLEDSSTHRFEIPHNRDAYIELDYKSTMPLYIGLRANLGSIFTKYYLGGVYPSDHWQKFYMSVKDFEAQYQATNYNLYLKAYLDPGDAPGTILVDNIQLVYFN